MSRTLHARPARSTDDDKVRQPRSAAMRRRARRTATRQAFIARHMAEVS